MSEREREREREREKEFIISAPRQSEFGNNILLKVIMLQTFFFFLFFLYLTPSQSPCSHRGQKVTVRARWQLRPLLPDTGIATHNGKDATGQRTITQVVHIARGRCYLCTHAVPASLLHTPNPRRDTALRCRIKLLFAKLSNIPPQTESMS